MSEYIVRIPRHMPYELKAELSAWYVNSEPIVRCRDCKHYDERDALCSYFVLAKNKLLHIGNPDGFCAWGERIEVGE